MATLGEHGIETGRTLIPRSSIQYYRSKQIQLPGTLFVTIFEWFPFPKLVTV